MIFLAKSAANLILWIAVMSVPPGWGRPREFAVGILVSLAMALSFVGVFTVGVSLMKTVMTRPVLGRHVLGMVSRSMLMYTLMFGTLRWFLGTLPEPSPLVDWVIKGMSVALVGAVLVRVRSASIVVRIGAVACSVLGVGILGSLDLLAILVLAGLVWALSHLRLECAPHVLPRIVGWSSLALLSLAALECMVHADPVALIVVSAAAGIGWTSSKLDARVLRDLGVSGATA